MSEKTYILGADANVLFLLLIILIVTLALITLIMSLRLTRLIRKYRIFMRGKDGVSLEKSFADKFSKVSHITEQSDKNKDDISILTKRLGTALTHYGIVKYDAFNDVGGKMSFALAMLDDSNTGFILDTIHSRDNCFLYIKEILNGESYIMLSKEEVEALNIAIDNREAEKFLNN